jgi:hypothetical protein
MVISKNEKHREYAGFAMHCLEMVPETQDPEFFAVQRKMAAEWVKLADAVLDTPAKTDDMIA